MSIKNLVSALPIVAQALGDQYGVDVVIGGSQACTNGRTIHLPALPPDDAVATLLARGYLDHESGHIRHTDFGALPQDRTPLLRRLANRLEDIRIEQAMGQRYPGVRTNLNRLVRQLVADRNFQVPAVDDHPAAIVCSYVLQRLRAEVLTRRPWRCWPSRPKPCSARYFHRAWLPSSVRCCMAPRRYSPLKTPSIWPPGS